MKNENEEEEIKFSTELYGNENTYLNQEFKDFGQRPSSNNTVKKLNFPKKLPQYNENILKHSKSSVKLGFPASKAF